jgi:transcriptional regulator with XRE-family HTH domain
MAKPSRVRRRIKAQYPRGGPNPIDIHVGARVRLRRNLLGLTLQTLAKAVGVTYQQLQKYEWGVNRIGASRLFNLSQVLDVPISFFFDDLSPAAAGAGRKRRAKGFSAAPATALDFDVLSKQETIKLIRAYYRVTDPQLRKRVLDLLEAVGKPS